MKEVILYPTETIYGLGVNALDRDALKALFALKGRDESQTASWLVRDIADIEKYAELSEKAVKIAGQFLPGPLTLILRAKKTVPVDVIAADGTVGFRISSDPVAQKLIAEHMVMYDAPLTCTSANVHGMVPAQTPQEICNQFGSRADMITRVIDDGPRGGTASTVVRVLDGKVEILREGSIAESEIGNVCAKGHPVR